MLTGGGTREVSLDSPDERVAKHFGGLGVPKNLRGLVTGIRDGEEGKGRRRVSLRLAMRDAAGSTTGGVWRPWMEGLSHHPGGGNDGAVLAADRAGRQVGK